MTDDREIGPYDPQPPQARPDGIPAPSTPDPGPVTYVPMRWTVSYVLGDGVERDHVLTRKLGEAFRIADQLHADFARTRTQFAVLVRDNEDPEHRPTEDEVCPRCGGWFRDDDERCPECGVYAIEIDWTRESWPAGTEGRQTT